MINIQVTLKVIALIAWTVMWLFIGMFIGGYHMLKKVWYSFYEQLNKVGWDWETFLNTFRGK